MPTIAQTPSSAAAFIALTIPPFTPAHQEREIKVEWRKGTLSMTETWHPGCSNRPGGLDRSPTQSPHMIRIDAVWPATVPLGMLSGTDTSLARVVVVFSASHPHTAYTFLQHVWHAVEGLGVRWNWHITGGMPAAQRPLPLTFTMRHDIETTAA
jgi:hypothetical protein